MDQRFQSLEAEELPVGIFGLDDAVGLAHRLVHRDYLLPVWLVVPFLIEGRSAVLPAAIPLAMLASLSRRLSLRLRQVSARLSALLSRS